MKTEEFEASDGINDQAIKAAQRVFRSILGEEVPELNQRRKHRETTEEQALLMRLKRIEGQVRGVQGMIEKESYCPDILTQVSAIQSALNAFSRELLSNHIRTCVLSDIQAGNLEVVDELVATIQKMMTK